MNLPFYGTIESLEVSGSTVTLRCVREFFHPDGLLADDVWLWSISDTANVAGARTLHGRSTCGFEVEDQSLRVWLDEGDKSVSIAGSRVWKVEESRSGSDLERVIVELSARTQRDEIDHLALTRKIRDVATSIYQLIDRLQRRADFEQQRRSETPKEFAREIDDLQGILRRLEEPIKSEEAPTTPFPPATPTVR